MGFDGVPVGANRAHLFFFSRIVFLFLVFNFAFEL